MPVPERALRTVEGILSGSYFLTTFLPVVAFMLAVFIAAALLSYRLHLTDQFLWFKQRPIAKTKDYDVIHNMIIQQVRAEGAEDLLTPQARERIAGAAEKAVPQLRLHGSIEVRLPALYEADGRPHDIVVALTLKTRKQWRQ